MSISGMMTIRERRLQDAGVPFVIHVGSGGRLVPTGYRDNGRPLPP